MRQLRHPRRDEFRLTAILAALSDSVRLRIVTTLADGAEHAWGEFDLGVGPSTLSHHMKILRTTGLINHRKDGTRCFVSLRPDLSQVFPGLLSTILGFVDASTLQAATESRHA